MTLMSAVVVASVMTATAAVGSDSAAPQSNDWIDQGQEEMARTQALHDNNKKPKNVILFVGDGMGVSTVTAARILEGQLRGESGEENLLSFEEFPHVALSKVYNTDAQVPDSAGTMTAMMTGVKTDMGVIGVDEDVERGDCSTVAGNDLPSWMMQAEKAGMATGVVSTARITHATPAATYAVSPDRNWEDVSDIPAGECEDYPDIAQQLTAWGDTYGDGFEVVLGGGRRHFLPTGSVGPEGDEGDRTDGRDLTQEWEARGDDHAYVDTKTGLDAVDLGVTDHVLGLFEESHLEYEHDRAGTGDDEPSLEEMTRFSIDMLQRDSGKGRDQGFALMVEAGRIDHAHPGTNAYRALTDTVELAQAVKAATEMVDLSETMIVVTADHSHVFTIAGYPDRGNDILGSAGVDAHGTPYTTLGYQNGASVDYAHDHDEDGDYDADDHDEQPLSDYDYEPDEFGRFDPSAQMSHPDFQQQTLVELGSETHSGEDVAIYANGPYSHLFNGVKEQNYVGVVILEALGLL